MTVSARFTLNTLSDTHAHHTITWNVVTTTLAGFLAFNVNRKDLWFRDAFFLGFFLPFSFQAWPHNANECKQSRRRGFIGTFLRQHTIPGLSRGGGGESVFWVTFLQSPQDAWVSAVTHDARGLQFSRQQAHAGKLSRQEGVQDKHHRLRTRVEVEYLEEEGKQERLYKLCQYQDPQWTKLGSRSPQESPQSKKHKCKNLFCPFPKCFEYQQVKSLRLCINQQHVMSCFCQRSRQSPSDMTFELTISPSGPPKSR